MQGICELLDEGDSTKPYSSALAVQAAKIKEVELTPSARLIRELRDTGESFFDLALRTSATHKAYFLDLYQPNESVLRRFAEEGRGVTAPSRGHGSSTPRRFRSVFRPTISRRLRFRGVQLNRAYHGTFRGLLNSSAILPARSTAMMPPSPPRSTSLPLTTSVAARSEAVALVFHERADVVGDDRADKVFPCPSQRRRSSRCWHKCRRR